MHQVHIVMEWSATAIDLTGSLIMVWAFVTSVGAIGRQQLEHTRSASSVAKGEK